MKNNYNGITIGLIALALVIGGGYFVFFSAIICIFLILLLIYDIWKRGTVVLPIGFQAVSLWGLIILLTMSCFWAIDKGMAFMGIVKFLPLPLFMLWLYQGHIQKQKIIDALPVLGTVMTVLSFVMMQFSAFEKYVSVSGRLSGFFQYPNTYAAFLLVCIVILVERTRVSDIDYYDLLYLIICEIGIFLSGSRTVLVLEGVALVFLVFFKMKHHRIFFAILAGCVLMGVGGFLVAINQGVTHIFDWQSLSTFWGRILYYKDSLNILQKYPLGMGYYGYYFVQGEMQTGVYSVVNVHNELLQLMLDIGIIPGIMMTVILVFCVHKISNQFYKLAFSLIMIHSLFDYDLQFISMSWILILFLENERVCELKTTKLMCLSFVTGGMAVAICLSHVMLSDVFYLMNDYTRSTRFYEGNTMALIESLNCSADQEESERYAQQILTYNTHVAVAYDVLALHEFSEGDIEGYIQYKLKAISLSKYNINEYIDYLSTLFLACEMYLDANDTESARICYKRIQNVPELLGDVERNTDELAWKIRDTPELTLPEEIKQLIGTLEEKIEEASNK